MNKQDDFIKYRISQELRRQFSAYASKVEISQSELIRQFIKTLVNKDGIPSSEKLAINGQSSE